MQVGRPLAKGQRSRPWLLALRALGAAAIVALCVLGLRRIDWRATGAALAGASVPLLALASLTIFTELLVKAERFRLLLAPVQRLPLAKLFYYIIVSYAASMLLPGPVGATLRVYVLERRHAVPVAASIAALLFEKLFEGIGLVFVVAGLPFLLPLPRAISLLIAALSLGGVAVAAAVVLVVRHAERRGYAGRLSRVARLAPGAACVRRPSLFLRASALSLLAQLIDCVAMYLVLRAVGLDLPWATGGLLILALSFALTLPLTPLHLGALEAGAVGALDLLGAPFEKAVAFGLVYHALQAVPVLVLGLTGYRLMSEARADRAREDTP